MVGNRAGGVDMRAALVGADPGPPKFKLGDLVWVGGRTHPSGWAFVSDIHLQVEVGEERGDVLGYELPRVERCEWQYLVCWEKSGREWGWLAAKELGTEEPE